VFALIVQNGLFGFINSLLETGYLFTKESAGTKGFLAFGREVFFYVPVYQGVDIITRYFGVFILNTNCKEVVVFLHAYVGIFLKVVNKLLNLTIAFRFYIEVQILNYFEVYGPAVQGISKDLELILHGRSDGNTLHKLGNNVLFNKYRTFCFIFLWHDIACDNRSGHNCQCYDHKQEFFLGN
jgi:hypothetical protein